MTGLRAFGPEPALSAVKVVGMTTHPRARAFGVEISGLELSPARHFFQSKFSLLKKVTEKSVNFPPLFSIIIFTPSGPAYGFLIKTKR